MRALKKVGLYSTFELFPRYLFYMRVKRCWPFIEILTTIAPVLIAPGIVND